MKSYCSSPFPLPTKAMSVMCCLLLFVGLLACSPWINSFNEGSFIQQSLRMEIVYNYMFHALNEYAKLLKYKPMVPPKAKEICFESMACHAEGLEKAFMMQSMINASETSVSCALPPPFDPSEMKLLFDKMADSMKEVKRQELSRNLEIRNSTG